MTAPSDGEVFSVDPSLADRKELCVVPLPCPEETSSVSAHRKADAQCVVESASIPLSSKPLGSPLVGEVGDSSSCSHCCLRSREVDAFPNSTSCSEVLPRVETSLSDRPRLGGRGQVSCQVPRKGLVLELCARSATLSSCFAEARFEVLPVDHQTNRYHTLAKTCNLSLAEESSWEYLRWVCETFPVQFVHAAPPHGTCAKKRVSVRGLDRAPVRSEAWPWGFPDLSSADRARVDCANAIFKGLVSFISFLDAKGILWSLENPKTSMLWELPPLRSILERSHSFCLQACAYGGPRPGWRMFVTNVPGLRSLAASCPGGHVHQHFLCERGGSEDANYPRPLCVQIVQQVCLALGVPALDEPSAAPVHASHAITVAACKQPRGRHIPPVMSEFADITSLDLDRVPPVNTKRRLLTACRHVPAGSKLLSFVKVGDEQDSSFRCFFGCYRTKEVFLREAMRLVHPFDKFLPLPDEVKRTLFATLCHGPAWIAARRAETLGKWTSWAADLLPKDLELRSSLEPGVRKVLKSKRLLLLQRIAEDIDWPDAGLFQQIQEGFELVGNQGPSGVFATELRPAQLTVSQLDDLVKFMKPALLGKVRSADLDDDAQLLWDKTMQEVSEGLLEGPLTVQQVEERYGGAWIPVRRFGVWQSSSGKQKLRPIDDYSENKVNLAFGYADKIDLRALDQLVCSVRLWMQQVLADGKVAIELSDGSCLRGSIHPCWRSEEGRLLELATLDLRAAYKQFPLSPKSRALSVLVLKNPVSKEVACFEAKALPFGGTASVVHFNRAARLLWAIGQHLHVCWLNFFDDYPILTPRVLAGSTKQTLKALVDLLGFDCSWEKWQDFSTRATMLGVEVDLSDVASVGVRIRNKEGRAGQVVSTVEELLRKESMPARELLSVMGRIQFADAQVMGRTGRLALAEIRRWSRNHVDRVTVGRELMEAFGVLTDRLSSGTPRVVPCELPKQPVLVFTDGASEDALHTVGGILIRPGCDARFFACHVPSELVKAWEGSLKHLIGPVETYAALVARAVWHQFLSGQTYLHFIDNVGSQDSYVKGTSTSAIIRSLLVSYERIESNGASWPWFARVPSDSNPSDEPSRGVFDGIVKELAAKRDVCLCPMTGRELCDITSQIPEGVARGICKLGEHGTSLRPHQKRRCSRSGV